MKWIIFFFFIFFCCFPLTFLLGVSLKEKKWCEVWKRPNTKKKKEEEGVRKRIERKRKKKPWKYVFCSGHGVKVMKNMKAAKWTVYKSAANFAAGKNKKLTLKCQSQGKAATWRLNGKSRKSRKCWAVGTSFPNHLTSATVDSTLKVFFFWFVFVTYPFIASDSHVSLESIIIFHQ